MELMQIYLKDKGGMLPFDYEAFIDNRKVRINVLGIHYYKEQIPLPLYQDLEKQAKLLLQLDQRGQSRRVSAKNGRHRIVEIKKDGWHLIWRQEHADSQEWDLGEFFEVIVAINHYLIEG